MCCLLNAMKLDANAPPSPFFSVLQNLLMKPLAPCCAHRWKTAPCLLTTAPTASSMTRMAACSASASAVSPLSFLVADGSEGFKASKGAVPTKHQRDAFLPTCCVLLFFFFFLTEMSERPHQPQRHVRVSRNSGTVASDGVGLSWPPSRDLSLHSFRRLLPRPGKILPAAVPHGIREGRLWLRGVRVQHPRAQVPTPDL